MTATKTSLELATVSHFDEKYLLLYYFDNKGKMGSVHWTSYWSTVPGLVPQKGERIELIYNTSGYLLGARPTEKTQKEILIEKLGKEILSFKDDENVKKILNNTIQALKEIK